MVLLLAFPAASDGKTRGSRPTSPELVLRVGPAWQSLTLYKYDRYDVSGPGFHGAMQLTGKLSGRGTFGLAMTGSYAPKTTVEEHDGVSHDGRLLVLVVGPVGKLNLPRGLFAELLAGLAYVGADFGRHGRFGNKGLGVGVSIGQRWKPGALSLGWYVHASAVHVGVANESSENGGGTLLAGGVETAW